MFQWNSMKVVTMRMTVAVMRLQRSGSTHGKAVRVAQVDDLGTAVQPGLDQRMRRDPAGHAVGHGQAFVKFAGANATPEKLIVVPGRLVNVVL